MAHPAPAHGWGLDGSPAVPSRRERRRTPPSRHQVHRSADASAPSAAERHLAELQARRPERSARSMAHRRALRGAAPSCIGSGSA